MVPFESQIALHNGQCDWALLRIAIRYWRLGSKSHSCPTGFHSSWTHNYAHFHIWCIQSPHLWVWVYRTVPRFIVEATTNRHHWADITQIEDTLANNPPPANILLFDLYSYEIQIHWALTKSKYVVLSRNPNTLCYYEFQIRCAITNSKYSVLEVAVWWTVVKLVVLLRVFRTLRNAL